MPVNWRYCSESTCDQAQPSGLSELSGPQFSRWRRSGGGFVEPPPCGFMPPLATSSRNICPSIGTHSCLPGVPPFVCTAHLGASPPMASASCFGPSASRLPSQPSRRAAISSSFSAASTSPHSSFKPFVLSGPRSPFSHASKATPAPQEKWLHSIPRLLIFSARYNTALPLIPRLKKVSSHSPPALKWTTVPLNSPSPSLASQGQSRAH